MTDLLTYLFEKFKKSPHYSADARGADEFVQFAQGFLKETPPGTIRYGEAANFVIQFVNGDKVVIVPLAEEGKGGMQRGGTAVPVTGHDTAREILKHGGP